jgi:hypothetical protein
VANPAPGQKNLGLRKDRGRGDGQPPAKRVPPEKPTPITVLILANDVERVLADIDADYGGRSVEFL